MSQRTLIELNHDRVHDIAARGDEFVVLLTRLLHGSARPGDKDELRDTFGVRVFGRRHHGDAFEVTFGGKHISEPHTP